MDETQKLKAAAEAEKEFYDLPIDDKARDGQVKSGQAEVSK